MADLTKVLTAAEFESVFGMQDAQRYQEDFIRACVGAGDSGVFAGVGDSCFQDLAFCTEWEVQLLADEFDVTADTVFAATREIDDEIVQKVVDAMNSKHGSEKVLKSWIDGEDRGDLDRPREDGTTPRQWIAQGLPKGEAIEWMNAGCFDPESVPRLAILGFAPEDVALRIDEEMERKFGLSYAGYSIGYMFCNGDLDSAEQLRKLVDYACQ